MPPQAASTAHLRRLLRALPASAYHPQSYTVMRELLEQSHVVTSNMGGAIFSGASVTAGTGNHPYTHLAPLSHELLPQASPRWGHGSVSLIILRCMLVIVSHTCGAVAMDVCQADYAHKCWCIQCLHWCI